MSVHPAAYEKLSCLVHDSSYRARGPASTEMGETNGMGQGRQREGILLGQGLQTHGSRQTAWPVVVTASCVVCAAFCEFCNALLVVYVLWLGGLRWLGQNDSLQHRKTSAADGRQLQ